MQGDPPPQPLSCLPRVFQVRVEGGQCGVTDGPGLAPGCEGFSTPTNQHPDCQGVLLGPDRNSPGGALALGGRRDRRGGRWKTGSPLLVTPLSMQAKWQAKKKRRSEPRGHSQTLWVTTGHPESREGSWSLSPESASSPHVRPSLALSALPSPYSSHMSSRGPPQGVLACASSLPWLHLRTSLGKM